MDDISKFLAVFEEFLKNEKLDSPGKKSGRSSQITVKELYIYPVKSTGGSLVDSIEFDDSGIPVNDRILSFVSKKSGQIVTAKRTPKISMIRTNLKFPLLKLTSPGMPVLTVNLNDIEETVGNFDAVCETRVCLRKVQMINCGQDSAQWGSTFLNEAVKARIHLLSN